MNMPENRQGQELSLVELAEARLRASIAYEATNNAEVRNTFEVFEQANLQSLATLHLFDAMSVIENIFYYSQLGRNWAGRQEPQVENLLLRGYFDAKVSSYYTLIETTGRLPNQIAIGEYRPLSQDDSAT